MLLPLNHTNWPESLTHMADGFASKLNVYRVMAHNPALLCSWANLRNHLVQNSALSKTALEIVILRTGHKHNSRYEWAHHVIRGRDVGLSEERIAACALPANQCPLADDQTLLIAVDELVDTARLTPQTLENLQQYLGKEGVLDVMALVGMYTTLAFIVNSFNTPIDDDIEQALAERPAPSSA